MSKVKDWFAEKFHKVDKDDLLKWGFTIGAGVLTLVGGIFDQRRKDRLYREQIPKEVERQAKRLLDEMKKS